MSVKEKLYGRRDLKGNYTHTKQENAWGIIPASHCGDNSPHMRISDETTRC